MIELYKFHIELSNYSGILLFIFLFVCQIIYIKIISISNFNFKSRWIKEILMSNTARKEIAIMGLVVYILFFCMIMYSFITKDAYIIGQYYMGNYSVIDGVVDNFKEFETEESFCIKDVKFQYSKYDNVGYNKLKKSGGVITVNGQRLQVGYVIYHHKNIIMFIYSYD